MSGCHTVGFFHCHVAAKSAPGNITRLWRMMFPEKLCSWRCYCTLADWLSVVPLMVTVFETAVGSIPFK